MELGEHNVQGLDYYYTLQGWLKGVNMPVTGDPGEDGSLTAMTGKDEFAFNLGYFKGDYKPIGTGLIIPDTRDSLWTRYTGLWGTQGLYNGNIAWMSTQLPEIGRINNDTLRMGYQAMIYNYDQLNRIMDAGSLTSYSLDSGFSVRTPGSKAYDVNYNYDPNGNFLTLQRYDDQANLMNDFGYEYYTGTNRLRNTGGRDYEYSDIGNLIRDNEDSLSIEWTPYGKVRYVVKDNNDSLIFRYDATGNRIEKKNS